MATDYILFIHGVNTRSRRQKIDYADKLIAQIYNSVSKSDKIKTIPLYWGDVNKKEEDNLLIALKDKKGPWEKLWFQKFRETQIIQFVGDAALYISRSVGSKVVEVLRQQIETGLDGATSQDRLHLVTHSWGTVILFDILFAERWQDEKIAGNESAMAIRQRFFGVYPNPEQGIRLASIHTMGSPIALFSLLDIVKGEEQDKGKPELTASQAFQRATHDITPKLKKLLASSGEQANNHSLPWRNYIHPGDPLAFPLNPLMYSLVDGVHQVVDLKDVVTKLSFAETLIQPLSQTLVALLSVGNAHLSYWDSIDIAREIVQSIQSAAK